MKTKMTNIAPNKPEKTPTKIVIPRSNQKTILCSFLKRFKDPEILPFISRSLVIIITELYLYQP